MIARRLFSIVALLLIGCINPPRNIPVRLEVRESGNEVLPDTVHKARMAWLDHRLCQAGDCPPYRGPKYRLFVTGRIQAGRCEFLSAHASERIEGGTHHITLNVTVVQTLRDCSEDVSFEYEAAVTIPPSTAPFGLDSWMLAVHHDGVPVPPYN